MCIPQCLHLFLENPPSLTFFIVTQSRLASPHTINPTKAHNRGTHLNAGNTAKTQSFTFECSKHTKNIIVMHNMAHVP